MTRGDYVLAGGARSDYYIDKFRLFSDPTVLRRIARLFVPVVAEVSPDLVGGTELGGLVVATAVSQRSPTPSRATRRSRSSRTEATCSPLRRVYANWA